MTAPKEFFDQARRSFGEFKQDQVDGINAIFDATAGLPIQHRAYIMATAWHETAETMQPIAEYGKGRGKPYGKPGKYGQAQYGRGYVQLTWDANYERADRELGLNGALLKDFNLAMRPDIAAKILVRGMTEGWFSGGKKLSDYSDYRNMRRTVNIMDKASTIAAYASAWEAAFAAVPAAPPVSGWWAVLLRLLKGGK